ncbi:uncharacterized protein LOC134346378 [Mobula hypostoma]|uniref:uncharacterized protein LOC134346378 n=1 Tax=Mobula hypostoma TaxID=723540 RepID=UPI002FC3743E
MMNLPEKNPSEYEAFKTGQFSVQLSSNIPFGQIPVDQAIEATVNKDTQTPGDTSRFSLNAGAIKRYYITAGHCSAFLGQLREMVQGNKSELFHVELQRPRIQKYEEAVSAVVSLIHEWVNPFAEKWDLINISMAKAAPKDIAFNLMKAYKIGEQCYATFKDERLEEDPPAKKFHDPMKTNKLKTFSDMRKKRSEIKWEGDHLESRQVCVWTHHSDGTRVQSTYGGYPFSSPWTISLSPVHTRRIAEKDK